MCGDHPSFTKAELNLKEGKAENKEKDRKISNSFIRISPTISRTKATEELAPAAAALDDAPQALFAAQGNRELVHAALGSFRWPPYLVCAWLLALALAHALHATRALLDRALPPLRAACAWSRARAGAAWRGAGGARAGAEAALAAALHALYSVAAAARALAAWALEPPAPSVYDAKVTNYDDVDSQISPRLK
ncbi:unnamed protein product, partial [Brenthis ino]